MTQQHKQSPIFVGHRGISLYELPENTLPALEEAVRKGFHIETDVQKVQGGLVLYHDDIIPGPADAEMNGGGFYLPAGKKAVAECGLDELLSGAAFDRQKLEHLLSKQGGMPAALRYTSEPKIAVFDDLVKLLEQERDAEVLLEIKRADNLKFYKDGMEEEICGILKDRGLDERVTIISFNEHSLRSARQAHSTIRLGADVHAELGQNIEEAKRMQAELGLHFWNPPFDIVTAELVAQIRQMGMEVVPWVRRQTRDQELKMIGELAQLGLPMVITNQAEKAQSMLAP